MLLLYCVLTFCIPFAVFYTINLWFSWEMVGFQWLYMSIVCCFVVFCKCWFNLFVGDFHFLLSTWKICLIRWSCHMLVCGCDAGLRGTWPCPHTSRSPSQPPKNPLPNSHLQQPASNSRTFPSVDASS